MPEDREWRTLQILEEHSEGIERKKLIEKMRSKFDLSHVPVENLIKKLMDMKKIDAWTYKPKARRRRTVYFPASAEAHCAKLPEIFSNKIKIIKERLKSIENDFETHSYYAQCHLCDEFCDRLDSDIMASSDVIKSCDTYQSDEYDEYLKIQRSVSKLLEFDPSGIYGKYSHRISACLCSAEDIVRTKTLRMNELAEKKKTMGASETRSKTGKQIDQMRSQIMMVLSDTDSIQHALQQSVGDLKSMAYDLPIGSLCSNLGYCQKKSTESAESMLRLVEKLRLEKGEGVAEQTELLNSRVSEIKSGLEEIGAIKKVLEVGGMQNRLIEELDSAISTAESHLKEMKEK